MSSKDYPYVVKEICYGNIPDNNGHPQTSYLVWFKGDCITISLEGLVHLKGTIDKILEDEQSEGTL